MKFLNFLIILILFLQNCSFDNKTGIWINQNEASINENKVFDDFKVSSSKKAFYQSYSN